MKFYTTTKPITDLSADVVVVFVYQRKKEFSYTKDFAVVDNLTKKMCSTLLTEEGFTGKLGSTFVIQTKGVLAYKRVLVVGLGKEEDFSMRNWQIACASIARRAKESKASSLVVPLFASSDINVSYGAVIGLGLGSYSFLLHKSKETQKEEHEIQKVTFAAPKQDIKETILGIVEGTVAVDATTFSRDLVNEPPSVTTPTYLASVAKRIARNSKHISCTVLGKRDLKKLGMNGLLGVSQGSHEEPKFVKLVYRGSGKKTITLVGKGITYDSGGLSLKPQSGLEIMKCDMAGAAAILGVFQGLARGKSTCTVVGLLALCENMPGGGAIKPGDIIRALNGKTIEIANTDAEGRVILADALSYAKKYVHSDYCIDVATLTGACVGALGEDIAGLFTDDERLAQVLLADAATVGEKLWQLPLASEYEDQLKSEIADLRNVSRVKYGGAINAALFLKAFAPDDVPWAHLDIAGTAFAEKGTVLSPYGGTGFGVRTLLTFIGREAGKK